MTKQIYGFVKCGPDCELISGQGVLQVTRNGEGSYEIYFDPGFYTFEKPPAVLVSPHSQYVTAQVVVEPIYHGAINRGGIFVYTGFSDAGQKDIPFFSFMAIGE